MNEQQIRGLIEQVFDEKLKQTQYNVASIPYHVHNQTDSPRIPPTSVIGYVPLPSTTGGIVNPVILDTQIINNRATTNKPNPPEIDVYPLPIIYGYGVGVHSAFNGGDAPVGSLVCFSNAGTTAQLFIKIQTGESPDTFIWRGVTLPVTA